ncbi:tRNA(Glu)-specific nuclease WapA precursor [Ruminiclostridium hungatei]|uniref:tRNA(Glu)-specific nuclease WapA n=1 Tax=Ruminiclostridium hungatei TaxID=48256 RepID=A0A1V4SD92_RUMHU|nr:tRNA(Glu)-specific nuclease WapA precursor [Ruminiclostridium hungatei]
MYADAYDLDNDGKADCSKTTRIVSGDENSPTVTYNTYTDRAGRVIRDGVLHNGRELFNTYQYDYLGNKIQEKSVRANEENWTEPYTMKYAYDYAGRLLETTDILGQRSTAVYDALGRVTAKKDNRANAQSLPYATEYTYDNNGRVIVEKIPFENSTGTVYHTIKKHYYDSNGNITSERVTNNKPGQAAQYSRTDFAYDSKNQLIKTITFEGDSPENYTQYFYDAAGNKLRMYTGLASPLTISGLDAVTPGTDGEYSVTKYSYDRFNRLEAMTDPLGQSETYSYDLNGNPVGKTDRNGNITATVYDGLNRPKTVSVTTPDHTGDVAASYQYILTGNKQAVTSGNVTTLYRYDDLGRLCTETSADVVKEYGYDANNNRKTFTVTKNGASTINTSYVYDKMNRLEQVYENSELQAVYSYDENGNRKTLSYTNGNAAAYDYNLSNKLTSLVNRDGMTEISGYAYTYYLDGNQASKTDNTGKVTEYQYDGLGRLTSEAPAGEPAIAYTYDDSNNRKTMTADGVSSTAYVYDGNNRLTEETKNAGQSSETTHYSYDDNGNTICKIVEAAGAAGLAGEIPNPEYMPEAGASAIQGQTTEADISDTGAAEEIKSAGTVSTETALPGTTSTEKASPEITPVTTLDTTTGQALSLEAQAPGTGESNNEVNAENSITINEYNGLNQLVKVTEGGNTYSYTYNWDGLRASKTVNGVTTNHIWDGDQMVLETDGTGNVTNKYIRGINLIYSGEGENRRYFLYNGHGDTAQLTGTTGSSIKVYDYDAFGNEKNIDPNDTNLFRYCGEYFDKETGTIYLRARYYDPTIGRFITEDSYWGKDSDPLSLNLYTYCGNNPVNYFDPSGHEYIVVSGGRYSNDSKDFKYNFIEPAIKELRELRELDSKENITWVISMAGWSNTDREHFIYVAKDIGVDVKFIHYASDLTDYINCKDGSNRSNDKITKFFVFSHGLPGSIELGYSQDNASNYSISMDDIDSIDSNAFNNPYSWFGSCRTGTDVNGQNYSFAQKWVNQVGGTTRAIVGRSWYGDMNRGESLKNKIYRFIYGFSIYGSVNYPVTYSKQKAYWETFNPQN